MATKSENAEIAVLQSQQADMKADLADIKSDTKTILQKMGDIPAIYATKSDLEDSLTAIREEIKSGRSYRLIMQVTTIVITAVITGLIYYFINSKLGH